MHSISSITQSCICYCLLQPLTCLNHDATAILAHLIYLYSIDCTQVRSAEYDPNSPIKMPVCMCVCSRKTLFSLFAQTFHSFVLFCFFLSRKMHDKLTRRELAVVVQRLRRLLPLLRGRLRLSVLLVRIRYVRVLVSVWTPRPRQQKLKTRCACFFSCDSFWKSSTPGGCRRGRPGVAVR